MTVINNIQLNNSDHNNGANTNTHYVGRSSNNIKLPKPLRQCTHNFEIIHNNKE